MMPILVLLAILALPLLALYLFINPAGIKWPIRNVPRAKEDPVCGAERLNSPTIDIAPFALTQPLDIPAGTRGGFFVGSTLTLTNDLSLTETLFIVTNGNLKIDATISITRPARQTAPIDIVLVSLEGSVTMSVTSAILGFAAHGAPGVSVAPDAEASGRAGWNGGVIAIDAPKGSVSMSGAIHGICGGDGGEATAGQPAIVGVPHKQRGASAAGGCGGHGGDVIICALEEITIGGPVIGAYGGAGGIATGYAGNNYRAIAYGGDAGNGGDIILQGHGNTQVLIGVGAQLSAGENEPPAPGLPVRVSPGGRAVADGGEGSRKLSKAGNAYARGGNGGKGGQVLFTNCIVTNNGLIRAGNGTNGGGWSAAHNPQQATHATGGKGQTKTPNHGLEGGDAFAYGGDGGAAGPQPHFRVPGDQPGQESGRGQAGADGTGGDAVATSGGGGKGGANGNGGPSGDTNAQGGQSGGGAAAPQKSEKGVKSANADGAAPVEAVSNGA